MSCFHVRDFQQEANTVVFKFNLIDTRSCDLQILKNTTKSQDVCISFHTDLFCQFESDLRRDLCLPKKKNSIKVANFVRIKFCVNVIVCLETNEIITRLGVVGKEIQFMKKRHDVYKA